MKKEGVASQTLKSLLDIRRKKITLIPSFKPHELKHLVIRFGAKLAMLVLFASIPIAGAHPIDMDAIAQIESGGDPAAVGSSGEIGLYQISPIALKHFNQVHIGKKPITPKGEIDYQKQAESKRTFENRCALYGPGPRIVGWACAYEAQDLKDKRVNAHIANWYINWLYDRCWTVKDTIIAWNWGIGNWRKFNNQREKCEQINTTTGGDCIESYDNFLPQVTQDYLKKYEAITGEVLS